MPSGAIARLGTIRFRYASRLFCAAFSPDGRRLAAGYDCGSVIIWDSKTGLMVREMKSRHKGTASAVNYSPDGTMIISAGDDLKIRVWDAASGKQRNQLAGNGGFMSSLSVNRDGTRLVTATGDQTVHIWDVAAGKELRSVRVPGQASVFQQKPNGSSPHVVVLSKTLTLGAMNSRLTESIFATSGRESSPSQTQRKMVTLRPVPWMHFRQTGTACSELRATHGSGLQTGFTPPTIS